jgi:hypothetical protein
MALDAFSSVSTIVFLSRQHRNMSASTKRLSLAKVIIINIFVEKARVEYRKVSWKEKCKVPRKISRVR